MATEKLSAAEATRRQELGSAWILRRALKDNIRYKSWEDILDDPKYDELGGKKGIYPEIDKEWLQTFFMQQKTMLEEFSNTRFTEFNREYGFMKFISDLVKSEYGISKKDSWDPADIWCIKDEPKVIREITKIVNDGRAENIQALNAVLRTMFKQRQVVGVSLKKVSGKQAFYEEINIDSGLEFLDGKNYVFHTKEIRIDLSLKLGLTFGTQDTTIFVDAMENGKKIVYKIQMKATSTSDFNNLKWEPTASTGTSARLGKAPVNLVSEILKDYKVKFTNSYKNFPMTAKEFKADVEEYSKMFDFVNRKTTTKVKDSKEFVGNMTKVFMMEPHTANSKLMQLTFLYGILKLQEKERDKLITNILFIAQKKDIADKYGFGPFGKLY